MNVAHDLQRAGEVKDERLKALYEYKAVKDAKDMLKSQGDLKKDVSISVSIGSSKMTSEQSEHVETVNISNINAGGNVNITATESDVNLKGTKINAEDVTIDAKKNINIVGADNKLQTDGKTSSSSWALGASIDLSSKGVEFFGNYNSGKGNENGTLTTNVGSDITANDTLTLKSGTDTNIIGSQVKGDKVVATIGGDLNIVSKQDTDNYTAKNQNSGFGFSTGATGGITGSIGQGKTDSTYNSVTGQAGIIAGKEGFDITVGKNTDLKGAVIASEATPDKNKLSTNTLTYSDIQNKADYSSSSIGLSLSTGKDGKGLTPDIGMPVSGNADSTTKSAVATGTINVRSNPNQDLSTLNRDPSGALNALGKIFDKKTVAEKQELSNLFGQEAFNAIGDLALSQYKKALADEAKYKDKKESPEYKDALAREAAWSEGGTNKILLHTIAGGIMSSLGGNGFATGALSAGLNEAVQKELGKITDPGLHLLASSLVGAVAAKVIGGNGQVGATVTTSATKNNWLNHDQQMDFAKKLSEATSDEEKKNILSYYAALSQYNIDKYGDDPTKEGIEPDVLYFLQGVYGKLPNDGTGGIDSTLKELANSYGLKNDVEYYKTVMPVLQTWNAAKGGADGLANKSKELLADGISLAQLASPQGQAQLLAQAYQFVNSGDFTQLLNELQQQGISGVTATIGDKVYSSTIGDLTTRYNQMKYLESIGDIYNATKMATELGVDIGLTITAIEGAVKLSTKLPQALDNLISREGIQNRTIQGPSKAELNVPGTKYYNPNYKANMSAEDLVWSAKDSGKGLSTMGSATRTDAWEAGKAWVGPEAKEIIQNGELMGYSSKDGMRSFRLQYKPNEGMYRANFQENTVGEINRFGKYYGETKTEIKNVHVDIID